MADGSKGWCWKCRAFQSAANAVCVECGVTRPIRKNAPWTWQGALFLTVLVGMVAGIGYGAYSLVRGSPEPPPPPALFELLPVIGESPSTVDDLLGAPTAIIPIENVPENMPGEFRDYTIPEAPDAVTVRYYRNRAVFVTVLLPKGESSAEAALLRVGIDLRGVPPDTRAPGAVWWRTGSIRGKTFERVGALRGMSGEGNDFDMVQAELR